MSTRTHDEVREVRYRPWELRELRRRVAFIFIRAGMLAYLQPWINEEFDIDDEWLEYRDQVYQAAYPSYVGWTFRHRVTFLWKCVPELFPLTTDRIRTWMKHAPRSPAWDPHLGNKSLVLPVLVPIICSLCSSGNKRPFRHEDYSKMASFQASCLYDLAILGEIVVKEEGFWLDISSRNCTGTTCDVHYNAISFMVRHPEDVPIGGRTQLAVPYGPPPSVGFCAMRVTARFNERWIMMLGSVRGPSVSRQLCWMYWAASEFLPLTNESEVELARSFTYDSEWHQDGSVRETGACLVLVLIRSLNLGGYGLWFGEPETSWLERGDATRLFQPRLLYENLRSNGPEKEFALTYRGETRIVSAPVYFGIHFEDFATDIGMFRRTRRKWSLNPIRNDCSIPMLL